MIVMGMSSGTSVDGIDLAAVRFTGGEDGVLHAEVLAHEEAPLEAELTARVRAVIAGEAATAQEFCRLDTDLGQAFARAAAEFLTAHPAAREAELISSHGQTVWHDTDQGQVRGTLQIGQPAWIAERTGLPVLSDLRVADVAAGGQGAPLAGTWDALWLAGRGECVAALNLGGIANVSLVRRDRPLLAFDTGPANALLDALVHEHTGGRASADVDGRLAAAGTVNEELLARLLAHPYYALSAPKTTGKETFHLRHVREAQHATGTTDLPVADLAATLTELTARTVAEALAGTTGTGTGRACAVRLSEVIVSGGGARNPQIMDRLRAHLPGVSVLASDAAGLEPGIKEACLFALLGWLTWHGLPGVVPGATGAREARVLGQLSPGTGPLTLPTAGTPMPTALVVH